MNRYQTVIGIVINKKTTKESDVFVSLLTTNNGKIVALAKGAKTIKSSRLGSLQLANTIKAQIYQKDNFNWLSETQTIDSFLTPSTSLTQINLIFYYIRIFVLRFIICSHYYFSQKSHCYKLNAKNHKQYR